MLRVSVAGSSSGTTSGAPSLRKRFFSLATCEGFVAMCEGEASVVHCGVKTHSSCRVHINSENEEHGWQQTFPSKTHNTPLPNSRAHVCEDQPHALTAEPTFRSTASCAAAQMRAQKAKRSGSSRRSCASFTISKAGWASSFPGFLSGWTYIRSEWQGSWMPAATSYCARDHSDHR
eukprot:scaffold120506_cov36-Tisochrysis_lutea.AAC.4